MKTQWLVLGLVLSLTACGKPTKKLSASEAEGVLTVLGESGRLHYTVTRSSEDLLENLTETQRHCFDDRAKGLCEQLKKGVIKDLCTVTGEKDPKYGAWSKIQTSGEKCPVELIHIPGKAQSRSRKSVSLRSPETQAASDILWVDEDFASPVMEASGVTVKPGETVNFMNRKFESKTHGKVIMTASFSVDSVKPASGGVNLTAEFKDYVVGIVCRTKPDPANGENAVKLECRMNGEPLGQDKVLGLLFSW